jgi:hypothetical protein
MLRVLPDELIWRNRKRPELQRALGQRASRLWRRFHDGSASKTWLRLSCAGLKRQAPLFFGGAWRRRVSLIIFD